jgi:hypothetical protein
LMERLRTDRAPERAAIPQILYKLLFGSLLIVPFRWPGLDTPADRTGDRPKPGGCLFAVVAPSDDVSITLEQLSDMATRLSIILLLAALREAYPAKHDGKSRSGPDLEIMVGVLREERTLRSALKKINTIEPEERLSHVQRYASFLHSHKRRSGEEKDRLQRANEILRQRLAKDRVNVEEIIWSVMKALRKVDKSKLSQWRKKATQAGAWGEM